MVGERKRWDAGRRQGEEGFWKKEVLGWEPKGDSGRWKAPAGLGEAGARRSGADQEGWGGGRVAGQGTCRTLLSELRGAARPTLLRGWEFCGKVTCDIRGWGKSGRRQAGAEGRDARVIVGEGMGL